MNENEHIPHGEMEETLCRLAKGEQIEEVHLEEELDPETGAVKKLKRKRTTKMLRPDYRALIFWLTNRQPGRWKGKPKNEEPAPEKEDDSGWYDEDWME